MSHLVNPYRFGSVGPINYYFLGTIDHTKVQGSPSGFWYKIDITDNDLKTVAHGGKVIDGNDIHVTSSDGLTEHAFATILYSATAGRFLAYAQYPTALSSSVDRTVRLAFGDSTIVTSLSSTLDSSFGCGHPFDDDGAGNVNNNDFSPNNNDATLANITLASGGGASFNGTTSTIALGSGSTLSRAGTGIRVSYTLNRTSAGRIDPNVHKNLTFAEYEIGIYSDNKIYADVLDNTGQYIGRIASGAPVSTGVNHRVSFEYDEGTTILKIFVDGERVDDSSFINADVWSGMKDTAQTVGIGVGGNSIGGLLLGTLKDVFISDFRDLNGDWDKTESNAFLSPSTFITFGSIQIA